MPATISAAGSSDDRSRRAFGALRGSLRDGKWPKDEWVFEAVPGVAHPINRGLDGTSSVLRGREPGRAFFLKLLNPETTAEACFEDACTIARSAHALGIAPELLAADEEASAFLFDGLTEGWRFGTAKIFRDRDIRLGAVACLKQLHGTDALSAELSVFDRIARLVDELKALAAAAPGNGSSVFPEFYHTMCDWMSRIEEAIRASGHDPAPCKVENSLSNFMIGPSGSIRLVDFDRAAMTDPFSDIGAFCNEVCRTDQDIAEIVEAYCGAPHAAALSRMKLYMIASALHLGLWGIVSQYRAPRTEIEFFKYGQNQLIRCRAAISRWDVGQLLREV